MFGHVQANLFALPEDEKQRYQAAYCGLCRAIGKRHGQIARLSLTYDLTYLSLLLSSLYEPEETQGKCRCCVHPCKKRGYAISECTQYAADMTIALAYYKCLDDWADERKLSKFLYAVALKKRYQAVKQQWPVQCGAIESCMNRLSEIENGKVQEPDAAANCFGALMEELFLYKTDLWEPHLRKLGNSMGRYIYLADAAIDLEKDRKKGNYNPLLSLSVTAEQMRPALTVILGEGSQAFEYLPLVQDIHLLKNILYSGIWMQYNQAVQPKKKKVRQ